MQRPEMPQGGDAQRHGRDPLPFDPAHQRAEFPAPPLGHAIDQIVHLGLDGGRGKRRELGRGQGRGIAMLVKPDLFHRLPEIARIGVSAIKVEGRQRSPAYVAQVTRTLRAALDELGKGPDHFKVKPAWQSELGKVAEGTQVTLGAYNRPWR